MAAFRLGVVVAPLNTALRGESLRGLVRELAPCVLRTRRGWSDWVCSAVGAIEGVEIWFTGDPPRAAGPKPATAEGAFGEGDLAVILSTSGTTGLPKGVMWPHAMALGVAEHTAWVMGYSRDDTIYTCLPLFHINGLFCALYSGLLTGAHVVIARSFSALGFWKDIVEHQVTTTNMMGAIPAILWRREPSPDERGHRLRLGMVLPLPVERAEFEDRFGFPTTEVYGFTDAGIPLGIPFGSRRPGSCGLPTPGWQAEVFDLDDRPVADDVEGELVLRPDRPHLGSAGYWRRPETTVEVTRNLWFHTGDVVSRDADGWFTYRGRAKEMIRVSGENVAPLLVEATLLRRPDVEEVCVYGLPSDLGEDVVVAAVVPRADSPIDPAELRAFAEADLPYFAVPRYIWLRSALPKTETSKVVKSQLQACGLTEEHWDGGRPRRS